MSWLDKTQLGRTLEVFRTAFKNGSTPDDVSHHTDTSDCPGKSNHSGEGELRELSHDKRAGKTTGKP